MKKKGINYMQKVKVFFVTGATATGKTHFINHHFADQKLSILNIYDYQQKAYEEAGFKDAIPFRSQFRCLKKANEMHLHDMIEELRQGHDVVAEQTFYKAKRRIAYIDAIRKAVDAKIEIFVMHPSDERWAENIKKRGLTGTLQGYKEQAEKEMEFPNPAEGFDEIYEVRDDEIKLQVDEVRPEIVEQARKELAEEAERISKEDEDRRKQQELLESMNTRRFWHYCEVCGRKEYITAQEAFDTGWDYPPNRGHFGLLGPRTCGRCLLKDTLFWRVNTEKKVPVPVVVDGMLTAEERITWRRIKAEPESLLEEETEEIRKEYADGGDMSITILT